MRVDMAELEFIDVGGYPRTGLGGLGADRGKAACASATWHPELRQIITLVGWDAVPGLVIEQRAVRA
ncbi:hypothetical protein [Nonomuraea dietziae]|uniref:hypothetical protein n=1 Tax=Nonomuraea dietziae TaxID=65515 RepID=UPI0031D482F5